MFCASGGDAERAQSLKRYGIHRPSFRLANGDLNEKSDIPVAGYNFYMNNIAAAIGLEQSHHVASLIARYRANGACYERALANIAGIRLLTRRPDATSAYWTYNFLAERRSDLIARLRERGVASQRLHVRNDVYSCFGGRQRVLPGVDAFDQQNVSIPAGWWVSDDDREHIIQVLREGW